MNIDSYDFGRLVVEGREYRNDVILLPGRVIDPWWRKEGHRLQEEDLASVMMVPLRLLVIGTGMDGKMQVPEEAVSFLRDAGVEPMVLKSREACRVFNEESKQGGVAGAFHLTC
ncbi:MAG: hypothetical protein GXP58_05290 [Deltaproteobacteria bacterium]|nr:hypothetical protein [Deltaproteobacteria bacterium]